MDGWREGYGEVLNEAWRDGDGQEWKEGWKEEEWREMCLACGDLSRSPDKRLSKNSMGNL